MALLHEPLGGAQDARTLTIGDVLRRALQSKPEEIDTDLEVSEVRGYLKMYYGFCDQDIHELIHSYETVQRAITLLREIKRGSVTVKL